MCNLCGGNKLKHIDFEIRKFRCIMTLSDRNNQEWLVQSFDTIDVPDEVISFLISEGCTFIDYTKSKYFHDRVAVIIKIPYKII